MKKLTQDEIILKFKEVHGEKYDYTNINYVNNKVKVPIICPGHGIFWQSPHQHIAGHGCPVCGIKKRTKNITFSREKFIQKAQVIHGGKYDYSEVIYSNNKIKIKIICPIHGVFWQLPYTHLQGGGCLKCANNILTLEEIILKFREIHGEKYEYPIVKYFGLKHKITIICPIHGSFKQAAGLHLQGCGCPKCAKNRKLTQDEIILKFKEVHGEKYDYSKVIYSGMTKKIEIICPIHGIFKQLPQPHLQGCGCPKCAKLKFRSKGEIEMCEYIKSIYPGKVSENSRKLLGNGMELDVYLPELKLALEYNGDYWHKIREKDQPGYHENKRKLCNDKGIKLVEIWEKDWKKDNKNIKAKIATILEEIKINFQNIS